MQRWLQGGRDRERERDGWSERGNGPLRRGDINSGRR